MQTIAWCNIKMKIDFRLSIHSLSTLSKRFPPKIAFPIVQRQQIDVLERNLSIFHGGCMWVADKSPNTPGRLNQEPRQELTRSSLFKKRQALTFGVDVTHFVAISLSLTCLYMRSVCCSFVHFYVSSVTRPADGQHANCRNVVVDKLLMTHDKLRTGGDASSRRSFIFKRRSRTQYRVKLPIVCN